MTNITTNLAITYTNKISKYTYLLYTYQRLYVEKNKTGKLVFFW